MKVWDKLQFLLQFMSAFLGTVLAFSPLSSRFAPIRVVQKPAGNSLRSIAMSSKQKQQIRVTKPTPDEIAKMQIKSWSTWGCGVSKFPWTYGDTETAYMIAGEVTITPTDSEVRPVTLKPGDLAVFPSGMSCQWDVISPIEKHYRFD